MNRLYGLTLLFVVLGGTACESLFSKGNTLSGDALNPGQDVAQDMSWGGQSPLGKGPGESCGESSECRTGLTCESGTCQRKGDLPEESFCLLNSDCGPDLVCGFQMTDDEPPAIDLAAPKTCKPEGAGEKWSLCTTDMDCQRGFYCKLISFTGTCQPEGASDMGQTCETSADCMAGLVCGVEKQCGIVGVQIPLFLGEQCEYTPANEGTPTALFEVPRGGQPLADFYRLPFPNDVRVRNGKMDLTGHPVPGPGALGFDIVERVIDAMEKDLAGFGTNPVVFFRFSHAMDLDTIKTARSEGANILLLDVTDNNAIEANYKDAISISWVANTGRGLYICQNYLGIYVPWARPLLPNRTYAAIVTKDLKAGPAEKGGALREFARSEDFSALLSEDQPEGADMKAAWTAYAPLRNALKQIPTLDANPPKKDNGDPYPALGITPDNILTAAVFSTYGVTDKMAKFKEEMDTFDLAEVKVTDLVECKVGTVSPCDDGLTGADHKRGCIGLDDAFTEYQGKVRIPVFQEGYQEGKVPYVEPEDKGYVTFNALGRPVTVGFEEVCFSLTVPKGAAPANGFPVVLYGHGTNGNYRSHVGEGVAARLANTTVWNPDTQQYDRSLGFAVMGWDQILHGPRVGPAPLDPDSLVFNFRNPRASLGNFYQAAAETMVLSKLLANWATQSIQVDGQSVPLDSGNVFYFGHSQGGISGPLAIPFVQEVVAMIISGTGGGLVESLLRKESPVDIRDGVVVALQDENTGRTHPVLALLQNYYDPVDPINYGPLIYRYPVAGHRVPTFHPLGLTDTFTAERTMMALAAAMRAEVAPAASLSPAQFEKIGGTATVELPTYVQGVVTVEYMPESGKDGHFVVFDREDTIKHYTNFLGTMVLDRKPRIVE